MENFHLIVQQVIKRTSYATLLFGFLWGLLTPWKDIFAGLTIGSAVSLYFALSIARQVEMATAVAERKQKKRPVLALVSRLAMIALGVMLLRLLGYPSIWWFLVGLFTYQVILYGGMILDRRGKGSGK